MARDEHSTGEGSAAQPAAAGDRAVAPRGWLGSLPARPLAYLLLWGVLLLIILARRIPPAPLEIERGPDATPPFRIDLNHDPWQRIALIDGIGEILARRIVDTRRDRGPFLLLEEVMEIPGIPDRPIEEAREWLLLGPAADEIDEEGR